MVGWNIRYARPGEAQKETYDLKGSDNAVTGPSSAKLGSRERQTSWMVTLSLQWETRLGLILESRCD